MPLEPGKGEFFEAGRKESRRRVPDPGPRCFLVTRPLKAGQGRRTSGPGAPEDDCQITGRFGLLRESLVERSAARPWEPGLFRDMCSR